MAEPTQAQNTVTGDGGSATATESSSSSQGPKSSQPAAPAPAATQGVEGGDAGQSQGNSATSDGSDGADGDDGGRQRPGRAERKISELTQALRSERESSAQKDDLIKRLTANPIKASDVDIPVPDGEITPEQYRADVAKAADQIATVRAAQAFGDFEGRFTKRQAANSALQEIAQAEREYKKLDPNSDDYDESTRQTLDTTFKKIWDADPSYSYREHIDTFGPGLGLTSTTAADSGTGTRGARGQSANRSDASSRRSQKRIEDMSLDELEQHIHTQNAR